MVCGLTGGRPDRVGANHKLLVVILRDNIVSARQGGCVCSRDDATIKVFQLININVSTAIPHESCYFSIGHVSLFTVW